MTEPLRRTLVFVVRRRGLAVLLVGCLGLAGSAATTLGHGVPLPVYHDELSYLLAADTFVHGRLANPTHPFWPHFETFHVLQRPTYACKYPPGQGLLLALGTRVGGHPIVGVWLGCLALGAALCWMLQGWVSPRWALLGGALAVVHAAVFTYWGRSYWGGALPAAAGALVFGALPRVLRHGRPRDAVWLGLGLAVLANTRPFEGAVVSLAAAAPLGVWLLRSRRRGRWRRVATPLVLVLALTGAAMLLYDRAVTGDPWRQPYQVYEETYSGAPLFVGQEPRQVPEYRHATMRRFYEEWLLGAYREQRTWAGWLDAVGRRLARTWAVVLGPVLTLPWLLLPWIRKRRGVRLAGAGIALFLLTALASLHQNPHYAAPVYGLAFLVVIQGLRWVVARPRLRRRAGVLVAAFLAAALAERLAYTDPILRVGGARSCGPAKAEVAAYLRAQEGRDLVFVRYGPWADLHDEWIANRADIDAADIVWARSMGPGADRLLRRYFADRAAWVVEIGGERRGALRFDRYAGPD